MYVPLVLGSDKTIVSVATGHQEYHPLYMSLGNLHNTARCAHKEGLVLVGLFAIPKGICSIFVYLQHLTYSILLAGRLDDESTEYRRFRHQLFHSSLSAIFQCMKPVMNTPDVTLCADGHYRHIIYGFGPYIADYPEQILLACVVQGWCAMYVMLFGLLLIMLT